MSSKSKQGGTATKTTKDDEKKTGPEVTLLEVKSIEDLVKHLSILATRVEQLEKYKECQEKEKLNKIKLIPSLTNKQLVSSIAKKLGIEMTDVDILEFGDSAFESKVKKSVRGGHAYIFVTGCKSIVREKGKEDRKISIGDEILIMNNTIDALWRSEVDKMTVMALCFPLQRSDKKEKSRKCISAAMLARHLKADNVRRIFSIDLHNAALQGNFDGPFDNFYSTKLFAKYLYETEFKGKSEEEIKKTYIVFSPDDGGIPRAKALAEKLGLSWKAARKDRAKDKQNVVNSSTVEHDPDLVGKILIIIDDIIDSANTLILGIKALAEEKIAGAIALAPHGIFSKSAHSLINECRFLKRVIVTNTIPQDENCEKCSPGFCEEHNVENCKECSKIQVIDLSDILSEVIRRLEGGGSISELFD